MSKKNIHKKPIPKKEIVIEKKYKLKSERILGFEKRNFHTGKEMVLLIAGESVSKTIYSQFSDYAKGIFFEI